LQQQIVEDAPTRVKVPVAREIYTTLVGATTLAGTVVGSIAKTTIDRLTLLPGDFRHHMRNPEVLNYLPDFWGKPVVRAAHFFVPVDSFFPIGNPGDTAGILRPPFMALGRSGLGAIAAGRGEPDRPRNLWVLGRFREEDIGADEFIHIASGVGRWPVDRVPGGGKIFSVDASTAYDTKAPWFPAGAHTDLGSDGLVEELCVPEQTSECTKRRITLNFLINFTLAGLGSRG